MSLPLTAPASATVLVVDDEAAALQLTSATLIRAGYRVLSAASGGEALEKPFTQSALRAAVQRAVGLRDRVVD